MNNIKPFKNKKFAIMLTLLFMLGCVILFGNMDIARLRSSGEQAFNEQIRPLMLQSAVITFNMHTIWQNNNMQALDISNIIDDIQHENIETIVYESFIQLINYALKMHNTLVESSNASENDLNLIRNFYMDVEEISMIIRQSSYNDIAHNFNNATSNAIFTARELPVLLNN